MNAESNHTPGSHQERDLDRSIHDLLGRALTATPPTPQLPRRVATPPVGQRRSPWLLPVIGGIAAASVLIGVVVVVSQRDESTTVVPVTSPQTAMPSVAPPTSATSLPAEVAVTEPTSTTEPPTTAIGTGPDGLDLLPLPVTPLDSLEIAVASEVGLSLYTNGEVVTRPGLSLSVALPDGHGGLYYQRSDAQFRAIEYMNLATSEWQTLVSPAIGVGLRLHSLTPTGFLYSAHSGSDPESTTETLMHRDVSTGQNRLLGVIGGWESGTSQLHQAGDLIVGTWYAEANHGLFIRTSSGAPADVDAARFGLEESYFDCTDCPRAFGVTNDGSRLLWVDGNTLVVAAVAFGKELSRTELSQLADSANVSSIQVVGNLVIVNHRGNSGDLNEAIVVELFGSGARVINVNLPPGNAQAAPLAGPAPPSAMEIETAVTEAPPALTADHAALVVEAGGVSYERGGQTSTGWEGDAATALFDQIPNVENGLRDEGAVIETTDGRILHVRFDAEPVELFAGVNLTGVPQLLDSALINGRPKVLLTLRSPCPNIENCTETLHVLDLESGELSNHGEVGGWEETLTRATLSDDGSVVGDRWSAVMYDPFVDGVVNVVPAIPQVSADPVNCDSPCDQRLMMSPDSSILAWQSADGNLVIAPDQMIELPAEAMLSLITARLAALQFGDGYRLLQLDDQTLTALTPGQITDLVER